MAGEVTINGTGPIPQSNNKTPQDILMEQLLNNVVAPTVNSLLDVSATTTGTGTQGTTGTKAETETQSGTKTSSTTSAAQALINQQIAEIQGQLNGGDTQYTQLINNIVNQAAQAFNPTNAASRRSGAYNSTTLDLLANDSKAKATAAGAGAVLEDKRAKLASLVSLIEQNAQINKTEAVNSTGTSSGTNSSNVTENKKTNVEASKIGSGAKTAAAVGGAALLAKSLLGSGAAKDLTSTGINALKKIFDMSGTSTGLPSNWFDDLSSGTASTEDIIAALGGQEADQAAMEQAITDVFGSGGDAASAQTGFTSWLNGSGLNPGLFSSAATGAGLFSGLVNASDGKWGWADTGSTVGSVIGTTIGGPIGGAVGSAVGGAGGDAIGSDIESGRALLNMSTLGLGGPISAGLSKLDDGCFITTACMRALAASFDDNCIELTTLRRFRDSYIAALPNGPELIATYREYAPLYVKLINARPDAEQIWEDLYTNFILPAVRYIHDGRNRQAYFAYLLMLQYVQGLTGMGG